MSSPLCLCSISSRCWDVCEDQHQIKSHEKLRKTKVKEAIRELDLPRQEKETFQSFLSQHHHAFTLEDKEHGETDLEIDTGIVHTKKQRARQLPFALRQVVTRQLKEMQDQGVIQPSKSPWASPVVLVKKKDDSA